MKYDLHIHTKYSVHDGILKPKDIIKIAIKRGLSGIAVTDHNTIKGGLKAKEYETEDFKVIVGSEIKTERGEIIGIFLEDEIDSSDPQKVVSKIKDQNGIVIIPHPFDDLRKSAYHPTIEDVKYIDGIEVLNSRCVFKKFNDRAVEFAKVHRLRISAGSDAHFANEIGLAGIITETQNIREAIIKNKLKVYGKRSSILNHGVTKVLKLCRKIRFG